MPLRSAKIGLGSPALISDCVPMMDRVRPAQFTTTVVAGSGASARTRSASSAPGTLVAVGMDIVAYSSNRRASTMMTGAEPTAAVPPRPEPEPEREQGSHLAGGQRRRSRRFRDELAEGLARRVDVLEQFAAVGRPAVEPAGQQRHVGVAELTQPVGRRQRVVGPVSVHHDRHGPRGSRSAACTSRWPSGKDAANSGWPVAKRLSCRTSTSAISVLASSARRTAAGVAVVKIDINRTLRDFLVDRSTLYLLC